MVRPRRSQFANWRGVIWRILSKSARLYTVRVNRESYRNPTSIFAVIIVKPRHKRNC